MKPLRRLPAEWEPQSGVMLTWPHADTDWAEHLAKVEAVYSDLAVAISRREHVLIVCREATQRRHIEQLLAPTAAVQSNLRYGLADSNDVWARDHGPITVLEDGKPLLLDFVFNGWDGKYPAELDNQINTRLAAQGIWNGHPLQAIDFVLEGGGIEADGQGTLLVTASCLLESKRNPGMDRAQVEAMLRAQFNVHTILWLHHGRLAGDDTDGHIDTLARFCDERTIAYVACSDARDAHFASLQAMERELQALRTHDGRPYRLVPLPMPAAKHNTDGKRLPATYANFLIVNQAVLVPTYQDSADAAALQALKTCFPDREIIGIDCSTLILQYGSLHCVTMQLPAGVLA